MSVDTSTLAHASTVVNMEGGSAMSAVKELPDAGHAAGRGLLRTVADRAVGRAPDAAELARRFAALSDPVRLRLLSLLATAPGGAVCACDLVEPVGKSQPTVSHHLKILREAGLVASEKGVRTSGTPWSRRPWRSSGRTGHRPALRPRDGPGWSAGRHRASIACQYRHMSNQGRAS